MADDLLIKIDNIILTDDILIDDIKLQFETIVGGVEDRMENAFTDCATDLAAAEEKLQPVNNLKLLLEIKKTLPLQINSLGTDDIQVMLQNQSIMMGNLARSLAQLGDQVTALTDATALTLETGAADAVTRETVATSLEKNTKKTEASFKQIIKQTASQSKVFSLIQLIFDTIMRLKTMINLLRPSQYILGNNIIVNILRLIVIFLELSAFLSLINLGFEYFGFADDIMIGIAKKFSSKLAELYIMVFKLLLTSNSPIFKIFKAFGQGLSENTDIQAQYDAVVEYTSKAFSTILDKLKINEIIALIIAGRDIITDIPGTVVNAAAAAATFVSQSIVTPVGMLKEAVAKKADNLLTGALAGAFSYFSRQIPAALPPSASASVSASFGENLNPDNTRSLSGLTFQDFSGENFNELVDILRSDLKEAANSEFENDDENDDENEFGGGGPGDLNVLSDFLVLNLQISKQLTFLCDICIIFDINNAKNMENKATEKAGGKRRKKSRKHMKRKTHKRIRHKNKKGSKKRYKKRHSKRRYKK